MDARRTVWRLFVCLFVAAVSLCRAQVTPDKVDVLVIDPGHGGKDSGCVGRNAKEKDVVLKVARKFGDMVREKYPDVKVVYTRSDDRFVELWKRGQIANDNHADLFVSIHCNAAQSSSARGTETWLRGSQKNAANLLEVQRENAVVFQEQNHEQNYSQSWMDVVMATVHQDAGFENSIYFSQELQELFSRRISSTPNRGIKQGPFYVLWKSARPSVLTEIGFLSNPAEEKFLTSEEGQNTVARCLLDAFSKYKQRIDIRSGSSGSGEFLPSPTEAMAQDRTSVVERNESAPIETPVSPAGVEETSIVFKVQLAASGKKLELKPYNFKGLSPLSCFYDKERKLYKYYFSASSSFGEIQKKVQQAKRAGYASAFVVAFDKGTPVSVKQALEKLENAEKK